MSWEKVLYSKSALSTLQVRFSNKRMNFNERGFLVKKQILASIKLRIGD